MGFVPVERARLCSLRIFQRVITKLSQSHLENFPTVNVPEEHYKHLSENDGSQEGQASDKKIRQNHISHPSRCCTIFSIACASVIGGLVTIPGRLKMEVGPPEPGTKASV